MSRAKKNVEIENIQNQVCVFLFDCIYFNGESLLETTLKDRRESLRKVINQIPNKVDYVCAKDANEFDLIQDFLNESVKGSSF